jgi:hypothetical protein
VRPSANRNAHTGTAREGSARDRQASRARPRYIQAMTKGDSPSSARGRRTRPLSSTNSIQGTPIPMATSHSGARA